MLSKAKIKYIKSLQIKKFRRIHKEFVVEGAKSVLELVESDFTVSSLYGTEEFLQKYRNSISKSVTEVVKVSESDLEGLGSFESNNSAIAVAVMKENIEVIPAVEEWMIALDDVRDPGNLGTIIRIADWYGISKILCSSETADFYNPKVISSSMGSFTRVQLYYTELATYFSSLKNRKIYGATLNGKNVHSTTFDGGGILLMGNESAGIHKELYSFITDEISIPRIGKAESLNVSVATAILCDNILR